MRPEIVITDELSTDDCKAVQRAIDAGIYVLASAHFSSMESITKPFFGVFERYIVLDCQEIGKIKGIYHKDGQKLL